MPLLNEQKLIDADADATTFEQFINDAGPTIQTRQGATLKTLKGHLADLGYEVPVAYTSGLNITLEVQTVEELGVIYAPIPSSLPISSTPASFDSDDWYPVQIPAERNKLTDYTDFADALSTIGTHGELIVDNDETLGASTYTVPAGVVIITGTKKLTLVSGTTVNVNGIVRGIGQWLVNTVGTVTFDNQDIDIRWFGAVDGSDSEVEINAAIVAADTNNLTILIPQGTWKLGATLTGKDGVNLKGVNFDVSILQASANITTMLDLSGVDQVTVNNLQLDVKGFTVSQAILNKGIDNKFFCLKVHNTDGSAGGDNVLSTSVIGIEIDATAANLTSTTIKLCEFYELGVGIKVNNGPKNVIIRNNKFNNYGLAGILGTGQVRVTDEVFITRNYFSGPLGGGVQSRFAISLQALTFGYSTVVCSSNVIIGDDFPYRTPTTLEATDPSSFPAANKNEYVKFTAPATVDGESVLAGENWICITTTGGGDSNDWQLIKTSLTDGIEFETVDGLICEHNYVFGTGGSGIALRDDCLKCVVQGNHLESCDVFGLEIGTGSTTGTSLIISGNFMHNCARDQAANYTTHGGIFLHDLDDSTVEGNKVFCDITSSEQMPYGMVIEDCLLLTEKDNDLVGWLTSEINTSGTNTYTGEQTGLAGSGTINWDARKGGEITLTDATGVLALPSNIRPGLRPVLRIFGGELLDVSAFTALGGVYNSVVAAGSLSIAQFEFDDAGVGYIAWIQGLVTFTNSNRPASSTIKVGESIYNSNDDELNYADGGNWRDFSTGGTT